MASEVARRAEAVEVDGDEVVPPLARRHRGLTSHGDAGWNPREYCIVAGNEGQGKRMGSGQRGRAQRPARSLGRFFHFAISVDNHHHRHSDIPSDTTSYVDSPAFAHIEEHAALPRRGFRQ